MADCERCGTEMVSLYGHGESCLMCIHEAMFKPIPQPKGPSLVPFTTTAESTVPKWLLGVDLGQGDFNVWGIGADLFRSKYGAPPVSYPMAYGTIDYGGSDMMTRWSSCGFCHVLGKNLHKEICPSCHASPTCQERERSRLDAIDKAEFLAEVLFQDNHLLPTNEGSGRPLTERGWQALHSDYHGDRVYHPTKEGAGEALWKAYKAKRGMVAVKKSRKDQPVPEVPGWGPKQERWAKAVEVAQGKTVNPRLEADYDEANKIATIRDAKSGHWVTRRVNIPSTSSSTYHLGDAKSMLESLARLANPGHTPGIESQVAIEEREASQTELLWREVCHEVGLAGRASAVRFSCRDGYEFRVVAGGEVLVREVSGQELAARAEQGSIASLLFEIAKELKELDKPKTRNTIGMMRAAIQLDVPMATLTYMRTNRGPRLSADLAGIRLAIDVPREPPGAWSRSTCLIVFDALFKQGGTRTPNSVHNEFIRLFQNA